MAAIVGGMLWYAYRDLTTHTVTPPSAKPSGVRALTKEDTTERAEAKVSVLASVWHAAATDADKYNAMIRGGIKMGKRKFHQQTATEYFDSLRRERGYERIPDTSQTEMFLRQLRNLQVVTSTVTATMRNPCAPRPGDTILLHKGVYRIINHPEGDTSLLIITK